MQFFHSSTGTLSAAPEATLTWHVSGQDREPKTPSILLAPLIAAVSRITVPQGSCMQLGGPRMATRSAIRKQCGSRKL